MTEEELNKIHKQMLMEVEIQHGRIDKIYYCTAISDIDPCRKPNIGMGLQAKLDYPDIDFSKSLMIGDSNSDFEFANRLGIDFIKVNKNYF